MPSSHSPTQNHLLAALPAAEFARLSPHLELVPMPLGEALYESGGQLQHVYFPTTSIVSLLYVLEDGASAEIAVVGNEGILGISLFMGGETTPSRAVVQSAGHGYRLRAQLLKQEFNRAGPVLHLLLRYTQALITQMTQTAVCNRHHTVEQQLCRWLLLSLDRLSSDSLTMTQELIANMLGVRREGVTEAAGKLQRAGLIRYSRGRIEVLDRPGAGKSGVRVLRGGQAGIRSADYRHSPRRSFAHSRSIGPVARVSHAAAHPAGSAQGAPAAAGPANRGSFCAVEHGRRPQRAPFSSRDHETFRGREAATPCFRPGTGRPLRFLIAFHGSPQCPIQHSLPSFPTLPAKPRAAPKCAARMRC